MKNKKLFLDYEEDGYLDVGLIRLASNLPHHEIFFHLNRANDFNFTRGEDLIFQGNYNNYHFSTYLAHDKYNRNCWRLISNKSIQTDIKVEQNQLFQDEDDVKYMLNNLHDVDYIISTSDTFVDFSVILLPEILFFPIQEFRLEFNTELYQIMHYYE